MCSMANTYTLSITQRVNTLNRAERYPGVGAVSRESGGLAVMPGSPCSGRPSAPVQPPAGALGASPAASCRRYKDYIALTFLGSIYEQSLIYHQEARYA